MQGCDPLGIPGVLLLSREPLVEGAVLLGEDLPRHFVDSLNRINAVLKMRAWEHPYFSAVSSNWLLRNAGKVMMSLVAFLFIFFMVLGHRDILELRSRYLYLNKNR